MPQMLMIAVEKVYSLDHFEIDETEVVVDITLSIFNFAKSQR